MSFSNLVLVLVINVIMSHVATCFSEQINMYNIAFKEKLASYVKQT